MIPVLFRHDATCVGDRDLLSNAEYGSRSRLTQSIQNLLDVGGGRRSCAFNCMKYIWHV